jgi:hypothetical protein
MSTPVESATLPGRLANFTNRSATLAVIGLGRAGLPLAVAVAFAEAGFAVTDIDVDARRSPLFTLAPSRRWLCLTRGQI